MKVLHAFVAIFWGIANAGCISEYHPGFGLFHRSNCINGTVHFNAMAMGL